MPNPEEINSTQPLSEGLSEFIGAFIGDGYLDSFTNSVGFVGNKSLDADYIQYLKRIGKSLFDIDGKLIYRKDSDAIVLKFNSKMLCELLIQRFGFSFGCKTYTVKIPESILNSDVKLAFASIRGIFDTDGCVFLDKRRIYRKAYPRITLQTVSKNLAEQLYQVLSKEFQVYYGCNKNRKSYSLEVYGIKQLKRWLSLIGFSNERNLKKAREALGEIRTRDLRITNALQ